MPPESLSDPHGLARPQGTAAVDKSKDSPTEEAPTMAGEKHKEKAKSGDRAAHNDIERKYRTNLKDRISELRDSVPALRAIPEEGLEEDEEEGAASRLPKVSKARTASFMHLRIVTC